MAKKNINGENLPSLADVKKFIMLHDFLEASYNEMKDFSKKSPDGVLNERKVKSLNRVLTDIKDVLKGEPTASYLEQLDEQTLPTNSDVVLEMSQYRSAMTLFVKKYRLYVNYKNYWHTKDGDILAKEIEGEERKWK